jgi:hypothetical protein
MKRFWGITALDPHQIVTASNVSYAWLLTINMNVLQWKDIVILKFYSMISVSYQIQLPLSC